MRVWIIKYEWYPGHMICVWNKRGNCLEFYSEAHARKFLEEHPEAVGGHRYWIVPVDHTDENQMEYGRPANKWEYEED